MTKRAGTLLIVLVALTALGAAGATVASQREEDDTFCISCHTAPEVAYFDRAQMAKADGDQPVDLSSAHYAQTEMPFRCIDCHRGNSSLLDRATTLALGARDTLVWIAGRSDSSLEKNTAIAPHLLNSACVRCHTESLLTTGFENHFHNKLPDAYRAWQAGGQLLPQRQGPSSGEETAGLKSYDTTVTCLSCHRAHVQGEPTQFFLQHETLVFPACERCHQETNLGPPRLQRGD
jgi:hypothetical protein